MTAPMYTSSRKMTVRYDGGERYEIAVRDHSVAVDQTVHDGGTDTAPTPVELFVASLAGCVASYAGRYLTRHGLPREGLPSRPGMPWRPTRRFESPRSG
jgi:uncharacterized OsmC-like protein